MSLTGARINGNKMKIAKEEEKKNKNNHRASSSNGKLRTRTKNIELM